MSLPSPMRLRPVSVQSKYLPNNRLLCDGVHDTRPRLDTIWDLKHDNEYLLIDLCNYLINFKIYLINYLRDIFQTFQEKQTTYFPLKLIIRQRKKFIAFCFL